jgi:hypothetical protein
VVVDFFDHLTNYITDALSCQFMYNYDMGKLHKEVVLEKKKKFPLTGQQECILITSVDVILVNLLGLNK